MNFFLLTITPILIRKAAKVLASFIKPNQVLSQDQVIPPAVLKRAKGLAIITVLKAGFLFSGRAGSGVIVARLKDGNWSAPSAIAMAGGGAGGMIGVELTDFVFILNSDDAVKSFSEFGTITLGGNVSVSAGPLGRTAEAAASASTGGVSAVFSYSRSRGLYAGVSIEGSVILERREANRKFYGDKCTTKMILSGRVRAPPHADPLFRVLESRAFNFRQQENSRFGDNDDFYNDIPDSFSSSDEGSRFSRSRTGSHNRGGYHDSDSFDDYESGRRHAGSGFDRDDRDSDGRYGSNNFDSDDDASSAREYYASQRRAPVRSSTQRTNTRWEDDIYDSNDVDGMSNSFSKAKISQSDNYSRSEKPSFVSGRQASSTPKAVALYSFTGEESGDLPFKKGDVITILKKSESQDDWWTGRISSREGIFPANYVELV